MGVLSERINTWVENRITAWRDRLRGWVASALLGGIQHTFDAFEPEYREYLRPMLEGIRDNPETPPELKAIIEKMLSSASFIQLPMFAWMLISMFSGIGIAQLTPSFKKAGYLVSRFAKDYRLDPASVITAWRRDPETYEQYFADLRDQGWSDERIEALKFFTLFYPTYPELIHWLAREVFEEDMVERYGLDEEAPLDKVELFEKAGVSKEQMINAWRAHWEHASFIQVIEMLHRGLLTLEKGVPTPPTTSEEWARRDKEGEEALYEWYRVVEIPPYWRDRLTAMSWNVPTRVDVRRWWDMRTISEQELYNIYHRQGYHGDDLTKYVLWTKVYVAFPDLIARWKNGWISLDDVKSELTGLGMPAERVDEFIETKMKATEAERTTGEKDLTKTDIIKGVKVERISRVQGADLLMDIGYEEDEAIYILDINIPKEEQVSAVKTRELTKADIIKGLKTEIITESEAVTKLQELRYTLDDAEFLLKIYMTSIKPPVEPRDKEASKADIVLAVKKGLITPEDGYLMLQDIGFTPEAAHFILAVRAEETPFSPVSYEEFKDITQKWRRAAGREVKAMPEELKQAGAEVVRLTNELEALKRSIAEEEAKLIEEEVLPEAATKKLDKLRVSLHRAEAKLAAAKSHYDGLLAQWRHGG